MSARAEVVAWLERELAEARKRRDKAYQRLGPAKDELEWVSHRKGQAAHDYQTQMCKLLLALIQRAKRARGKKGNQ